jgi:hypothetical protein
MATVILSLVFGLTISGALYFIFFWPAVEPADDDEDSNS